MERGKAFLVKSVSILILIKISVLYRNLERTFITFYRNLGQYRGHKQRINGVSKSVSQVTERSEGMARVLCTEENHRRF